MIQNKAIVWSVAGSDNSCGAGIQADNATLKDFGVGSGNIVTAVTAQNSEAVDAVHYLGGKMIERQWLTLAKESKASVVKLGMLGSAEVFEAVKSRLALYDGRVVCDPILTSTSGSALTKNKNDYFQLFDHVDVLTPNQEEFSELFSVEYSDEKSLEKHALVIAKMYGMNLIVTGGEGLFKDSAVDLCVVDEKAYWLFSPKLFTNSSHGTGCSFSSAIAASLALGESMLDACVLAKAYLQQGLAEGSQGNVKEAFLHTGYPQSIASLPKMTYGKQPLALTAPSLREPLGLYAVVDTVSWVERCLKAGVKTVQLRMKNTSDDILESSIARAIALGKQYQAQVFINDYWQLAIKYEAYGVHLGQEDLDTADVETLYQHGIRLGVSTHSWYELSRAHALNPSYIAIGPIFETTTKQMAFGPQGIEQLAQWVEFLNGEYPLVAIGGIDNSNAKEVLATGVGSIAVVRAITEADDYQQSIDQLQEAIAKA